MPISVSCPSCSASFKVKDEYAGKRAKCPKCGDPISIPAVVDTVLMPPPVKAAAPVAARPVVASKPKPTPVPVDDEAEDAPTTARRRRDDDEQDEPPVTAKRKRGADDDADEPVSPKRKRGASDDDETPKGKRRRRDDDDEPKKKSALPLILGIVGGVLLLCGGGCAGVWFGVIVPAAEKAKNDLNAMASDMRNRPSEPEDGDGLSKQTINKLRVGMSQREVDAVFGQPGKAAKRFDTDEVTAALPGGPGNVVERWHTATMEGRVFVWAKGSDKVLVGYNTQPGARGGTVSGVIALLDGEASELIPLPGG